MFLLGIMYRDTGGNFVNPAFLKTFFGNMYYTQL